MSAYEEHFQKILGFINEYSELVNCHLVDFINDDLWNKCLPKELRLELETIGEDDQFLTQLDSLPELNSFMKLTKTLTLEGCSIAVDSKNFLNIFERYEENIFELSNDHKNMSGEFMNAKKFHEVVELGNIVATIATSARNLVIDAGAGKAYLSTFLAENHKLPVLAIDSSKLCHSGAINREKKLKKKRKQSGSLTRYVVEEISNNTDFKKMVEENFQNWNVNINLIITGLHTCGNLAHAIIRSFLAAKDIISLCIVPCCYHLTDETFDERCRFSKNARMLAQQSVERSSKGEPFPPTLFYRAVLQKILHSMGLYDVKVGRGSTSKDFLSYAKWAFSKNGVSNGKVPSIVDLQNSYDSYKYLKTRFNIFQMLRIHIGPVIEAAIMLDRIIFLESSKQCSEIAVIKLFDPNLSPRCYAIFANK